MSINNIAEEIAISNEMRNMERECDKNKNKKKVGEAKTYTATHLPYFMQKK